MLRIFVDLAMPEAARELLVGSLLDHRLVMPKALAPSVLEQPGSAPEFAEVDVAFGQPNPEDVANAHQLKWIHVSSSAITRYDNAAFRDLVRRRGILVSNSAGVYSEPCAVHALSFMLAQARNLPAALRTRAANGSDVWQTLRNAAVPLNGQRAVILGYGAIGKRLAELLRPLGLMVTAYRRTPRGDEGVVVLSPERLGGALATADHVIDILPDSQETRWFFDAERFARLKRGAVFYNLGRGATVDQEALLEALRTGQLKAAWLDVTDPEPLPDHHPLLSQPNCFVTAHLAGGHLNETTSLVQHFLANFERFVRGEPLRDRVM